MKCNSKQKCAASEPTNLRTAHIIVCVYLSNRLACLLVRHSSKYTFTADKFEGHIQY